MTKHEVVNKLAEVYVHLRDADTYCTNSKSIDAIRAAQNIVYDIGERLGADVSTIMEEIC